MKTKPTPNFMVPIDDRRKGPKASDLYPGAGDLPYQLADAMMNMIAYQRRYEQAGQNWREMLHHPEPWANSPLGALLKAAQLPYALHVKRG